jgi:hypothetical protein
MESPPELEINYNASDIAVSAKCSLCKVSMPTMKAKGASAEEMLKWFKVQFALHMREQHRWFLPRSGLVLN